MYKPGFNSVLVELKRDEWGGGNDESMLGKSYNMGTVIAVGETLDTKNYPICPDFKELGDLKGAEIMFNEGVEAGTVHEADGKMYGFIYWWDIRGVKR